MPLQALAHMLNSPSWLNDDNVKRITTIRGEIPLKWNTEDTILALHVFPEAHLNNLIYIKIGGKISVADFLKTLRRENVSGEVANQQIKQVAACYN
jgi:hypothetical protein